MEALACVKDGASVPLCEFDPDGGNERSEWAIGFQHNLSKRTRTWVEYEDVEDSNSRFRVGLRHDFGTV